LGTGLWEQLTHKPKRYEKSIGLGTTLTTTNIGNAINTFTSGTDFNYIPSSSFSMTEAMNYNQ
jgi:hypothetical protein